MEFSPPMAGDRVLVLRPQWLALILAGRKTLEVRSRRLRPGRYYLGSCGYISGHVDIGVATRATLRDWRARVAEHHVQSQCLPYTSTWFHPLVNLCVASVMLPYNHPRGAVGIVAFKLLSGSNGYVVLHDALASVENN